MAIYIAFFLIFFCSSMLEVGGLKKSQARGLFGVLAIIMILFVGLRYHTGGDWYYYTKIFNKSLLQSNLYNIEYGYLLLNKLFKLIFDNYYVLQFAVTLFVVISFYKLYKNYSKYPIVSLYLLTWLFFYTILMSQIRQSIALAIIVFATQYIFDRKLLHFLAAIFIACFFHISAVVAIPLYFLYRDYGKLLPVILMLLSQIFYFFPELTETILRFISPYLPDKLSEKAQFYITSFLGKKTEFSTGLFYFGQMILSIFTVLFIKPKDKKEAFFLNTLSVFIIIKGFGIAMEIIGRLEPYYLVYAIIAYTYLFEIRIKRLKNAYLITTCFLLLFFAAPFFRVLIKKDIDGLTGRPTNYAVVPYYNVLSHPPEAKQRKDWAEK